MSPRRIEHERPAENFEAAAARREAEMARQVAYALERDRIEGKKQCAYAGTPLVPDLVPHSPRGQLIPAEERSRLRVALRDHLRSASCVHQAGVAELAAEKARIVELNAEQDAKDRLSVNDLMGQAPA